MVQMYWIVQAKGDHLFCLLPVEKNSENTNNRIDIEKEYYTRMLPELEVNPGQIRKRQSERELLQLIRLFDDKEIYNTICFDREALRDLDNIIRLLDLTSEGMVFQSAYVSQQWFHQKQFFTLGNWIGSELEKNICSRFNEDRLKASQKQGKNAQITRGLYSDQTQHDSENQIKLIEKEERFYYQEYLVYYQNLLEYWKKFDITKRRKILSKAGEYFKTIIQNCEIEKLSPTEANLVDLFKRLRDRFYQKEKMPSKEEIQNHFLSFSENNQCEKFIESICFSSFNETASVTSIINKKFNEEISQLFSEGKAKDVINEERRQKKKNQVSIQCSGVAPNKKKKKIPKSQAKNIKKPPNALTEKSFAEEVSNTYKQEQAEEAALNSKKLQAIKSQTSIKELNQKQPAEKTNLLSSVDSSVGILESKLQQKQQQQQQQQQLQDDLKMKQNIGQLKETSSEYSETKEENSLFPFLEMCCMSNKCDHFNISRSLTSRIISSSIMKVGTIDSVQNNNQNTSTNNMSDIAKSVDISPAKLSKKQRKKLKEQQQKLEGNSKESGNEKNEIEVFDKSTAPSATSDSNEENKLPAAKSDQGKKSKKNVTVVNETKSKKEPIVIIDEYETEQKNERQEKEKSQSETGLEKQAKKVANEVSKTPIVANAVVVDSSDFIKVEVKKKKNQMVQQTTNSIKKNSGAKSKKAPLNNQPIQLIHEKPVVLENIKQNVNTTVEAISNNQKTSNVVVVDIPQQQEVIQPQIISEQEREQIPKSNTQETSGVLEKNTQQQLIAQITQQLNPETVNQVINTIDTDDKVVLEIEVPAEVVVDQKVEQQQDSPNEIQEKVIDFTPEKKKSVDIEVQPKSNSQNRKKMKLSTLQIDLSNQSVTPSQQQQQQQQQQSTPSSGHMDSRDSSANKYTCNDQMVQNQAGGTPSAEQVESESESGSQTQTQSKQDFKEWQNWNETSYYQQAQYKASISNSKLKSKVQKKLFQYKVTNDILQFAKEMDEESLRYEPSRMRIFMWIKTILSKQFESQVGVGLRLFGSCATGLSLPTSDIDLGISGFEMNPKADMISVLNILANIFERFNWVKSIDRILTATVPVIKLEVDPMMQFFDVKGGSQDLWGMFSPQEIGLLSIPCGTLGDKTGLTLKVDITVESYANQSNPETLNHIGFISTDYVNKWMNYYPQLKLITVIMKCYLFKRNLNTYFKGGMSSYCILIMIIAFFKQNGHLQFSDDYCKILMSFLKFYGQSFCPETTGISLNFENPYVQVTRIPTQSKFQVIEPLTNKIITQNTYLIDEILKEFEQFYLQIQEYNTELDSILEEYSTEYLEWMDKLNLIHYSEKFEFLFEENIIKRVIEDIDEAKINTYDDILKKEKLDSSLLSGFQSQFESQQKEQQQSSSNKSSL